MDVVFFFEVHQPLRLAPLERIMPNGDPRDPRDLFEWSVNREIFERVARRVYVKASEILLRSLRENRDFKFTMGVSGIAIDLMERWSPEALKILEKMVETERVELAAQTYYHSLAWLIDRDEFVEQVRDHVKRLEEVFGYKPVSAENTEFIYNNDIGCVLASMGFKAVLTEGVEWIQGFRGYNYVYGNPLCDIRVLVRNHRLSDDIGFRFSMRTWDQYPLTADKYASWLGALTGDLVLIAIDYETFGEHHWPETGIYGFLEHLPREISRRGLRFSTVSEAALSNKIRGIYDVPPWSTISWADERDLSAWAGNEVQRIALENLRILYSYAKALGGEALRVWRLYSMSDHFYYQATKHGPAGEVHSYFNPYGSPYKAQITYLRALEILARYLARKAREDYCGFIERFRAPDRLCFNFTSKEGVYSGFRACSFSELLEALKKIPREFLEHHLARGDIDRWLSAVLLADGDVDRIVERCSRTNTV
ncbi:MAG: glycoside hydrolase family 57 protein [Sulfolobales archaeon]